MAYNKNFEELSKLAEINELNFNQAKNTQIAYAKDWKDYQKFCKDYKKDSVPSDYKTVRNYLVYLSGGQKDKIYKLNTIKRRIAAIAAKHKELGHTFNSKHPLIKKQMDSIKRNLKNQLEQTPPLLFDDLKKIIDEIDREIRQNPQKKINYRDKAIILIGWFGAFRRSELVNLKYENVILEENGLIIKMTKSKTDQEGNLEPKGLEKSSNLNSPYCPYYNYLVWLNESKIVSGKIFRHIDTSNIINHESLSDKAIALIIKNRALKSGIENNKLSGHSFRAGFATELARQGATESEIMKTTQHKSADMVRRYIRDAEVLNTAAKKYIKF